VARFHRIYFSNTLSIHDWRGINIEMTAEKIAFSTIFISQTLTCATSGEVAGGDASPIGLGLVWWRDRRFGRRLLREAHQAPIETIIPLYWSCRA
jgi:hypothetical protein